METMSENDETEDSELLIWTKRSEQEKGRLNRAKRL